MPVFSSPQKELTAQQRRVILCCERGMSNKQTAEFMDLSVSSVKGHVHEILVRTATRNILGAVFVFNHYPVLRLVKPRAIFRSA